MDSKNALYFLGGTVLGVAGTIAFLWLWEERGEAEHISDEPEKAEAVETKQQKGVDKSSLDDTTFEPPEKVDYSTVVTKLYSNNEEFLDVEFSVDKNGSIVDDPMRISDGKFQELSDDGYDVKSLTLYSDGILADSVSDETMSESDAFAALGPNYTASKLQRVFSLGADDGLDVIFIRNNRLYTLYEVTIDDRTYKEVTGR